MIKKMASIIPLVDGLPKNANKYSKYLRDVTRYIEEVNDFNRTHKRQSFSDVIYSALYAYKKLMRTHKTDGDAIGYYIECADEAIQHFRDLAVIRDWDLIDLDESDEKFDD